MYYKFFKIPSYAESPTFPIREWASPCTYRQTDKERDIRRTCNFRLLLFGISVYSSGTSPNLYNVLSRYVCGVPVHSPAEFQGRALAVLLNHAAKLVGTIFVTTVQ